MCFPFAHVCFWIRHDNHGQFSLQNQLWQEWEWKLLSQRGGQGPRKGQNATLPSSIRLFCPGSWSSRARRRSYSNGSWKCLIRASPPSFRQSSIFGAQIWLGSTGFSSRTQAGEAEWTGCLINTSSCERESQSGLLNANVPKWTRMHA